jgi:N-acetyl-anhydromuramyl-L-alanine amidase AmpD
MLITCELRSLASQAHSGQADGDGSGMISHAFQEAAHEFGVPAPLLEAICYMEGRFSNNGGNPSVDNGYGCMHLIQNEHGDLLDRAAHLLGVSAEQLKQDVPTNIRGGAALLRADALQLSRTHSLPTNTGAWYGAVAAYSNATTHANALMYANGVYALLEQGFSAQADDGETITLAPQHVQPDALSASGINGTRQVPSGCKIDQNVDYPQAIDCLVPAPTFDCNQTPSKAPCTYEGAQRPSDYAIDQIVIHDIEGTAQESLHVFQNVKTGASVQYIVDVDGTVYQVVREKNIAYHAGNYWYNQHSIGIEHAGVDATGYRWYNASEYLASAKLVAYLLKKYHLPLNHEQIVSHGTIPSPSATSLPNHVDPGPYWLWDYYFKLIHEQGVAYPDGAASPHIFQLHPKSARRPFGAQGQETSANFNFFYLYNGPSTASGRIPALGNGDDITNVNGCIESDVSYYYLAKVTDPAGSGDTLYKIWYGVVDQSTKAGRVGHARLVWLAVPRGAAGHGEGTPVTLQAASGQNPLIYGQPTTSSNYVIGDAPSGSVFVSAYTVTEDSPPNENQNNPGNPGENNNTGNQNNPGTPGTNNPGGNTSTGTPGTNNPGGSTSTGTPGTNNAPGNPGENTNPGTPGTNNGSRSLNSTGNPGRATTSGNQTGTSDPGTSPIEYQNGMGANNVALPQKQRGKTDGAGKLWYEINYNHRQAWVPASEVTLPSTTGNG